MKAKKSVDLGMQRIVVSIDAGRPQDGALGSLESLLAVVEARQIGCILQC